VQGEAVSALASSCRARGRWWNSRILVGGSVIELGAAARTSENARLPAASQLAAIEEAVMLAIT
jgi:hypothetical protein